MSRYALTRLLESFFRRWYLYLLPLVLLVGFGVTNVVKTTKVYQSTGVMYVENGTLLSQLTSVRNDTATFQTPASITSQKINALLQTDDFVRTVAKKANLQAGVLPEGLFLARVRSSLTAWPSADNLVRVRASNADPGVALGLAQSTFDSFTDWVIQANLSDSSTAVDFFSDLIKSYQVDLDAARKAQTDYVAKHPGNETDRPLAEVIEINRLNAEVDAAQARYTQALQKSEEARLASAQTKSDVAGRFRVVDAPQLPSSPQSSKKKAALKVVLFAALGALFALAGVALGAAVDRTVRVPSDVTDRLHARVLAVLPDTRRS